MTLHFKKVKIVLAKGAIDKEREVVIETWNNIYIYFYLFIYLFFNVFIFCQDKHLCQVCWGECQHYRTRRTWHIIPCSTEDRLDISIVKTLEKSVGETQGREDGRQRSITRWKKKGFGEETRRREGRTQASGTVKQPDIESAMAARLWRRNALSLLHTHVGGGGYWWSRHIQAEHL